MTEVGNVYGLSLYQLAKEESLAKTIGEELSVLQEITYKVRRSVRSQS